MPGALMMNHLQHGYQSDYTGTNVVSGTLNQVNWAQPADEYTRRMMEQAGAVKLSARDWLDREIGRVIARA